MSIPPSPSGSVGNPSHSSRQVFVAAVLAAVLLGCGTPKEHPALRYPFREVADEVGLHFKYFIGATGQFYLVEMMGSGGALFDYDGDGDLDVYLVQAKVLEPGKSAQDAVFPPPAEHWPGNRLYRNELIPAGQLWFIDVTEKAGVGDQGYGPGAAVGDYDNDGDPDLFVTNYGPNVLYRNNGNGSFTDVTSESGLTDDTFSASAAFLDHDRDGDLDLYVAQYNTFTIEGNKRCYAATGERDYCGPRAYFPLPDNFYRNEGRGRFVDVTKETGIGAAFGAGLGVLAADFNGDTWIDLYVANDQTPNQMWINQRDGTFKDMGLISGTAYNQAGEVEAGMGVTAEDFDGDGDLDIFLTHLTDQTNTLYLNDGLGNFDDAMNLLGLDHTSVPFTGFGTRWFDYDNDSDLDLFSANGAVMMIPALRGDPFPYRQTNQLFRNDAGRFRDVSVEIGPVFEASEVSRGTAFGDIDNDGDTDMLVCNNNGPVRLLLNQVGNRNHWLQVKLEGTIVNRDAAGAQVALLRRGLKPVWRRASTDGSYLSASDPRVHFGLGSDADWEGAPVEGVMVLWPDGRKEKWTAVGPDRLISLKDGTGESVP